jgi:hypothetical protein
VSATDPNDVRDPRVDAAWRAASREEPPKALDDAIRAAARREIRAGPRSADAPTPAVPSALRPERWWAPLAAAATIGMIAIGLLQLSNPERAGIPANDKVIVSDMPAAPTDAKVHGESAREDAAQAAAPVLAASSSAAATAPTVRAASGELRERSAPTPSMSVPPPAPALRKDARASAPIEERAAVNTAPAAQTGVGRESGVVAAEAPAPSPPVAEPFPADAMKRESKTSLADSAAPPASMPAKADTEGQTSGKLAAEVAPLARNESARDAQRAAAPVAQFATPSPPAMRPKEAGAARAQAVAASSSDSTDARARAPAKLAAPDWISLIRKLRDEGRIDDAAKELAAFRAAYPDHERLLPQDLRDWKPVPR